MLSRRKSFEKHPRFKVGCKSSATQKGLFSDGVGGLLDSTPFLSYPKQEDPGMAKDFQYKE